MSGGRKVESLTSMGKQKRRQVMEAYEKELKKNHSQLPLRLKSRPQTPFKQPLICGSSAMTMSCAISTSPNNRVFSGIIQCSAVR